MVERQGIDWQPVFAREILKDSSEEGLREEKSREPGGNRSSIIYPRSKHGKALTKVSDIRAERLDAGVGAGNP